MGWRGWTRYVQGLKIIKKVSQIIKKEFAQKFKIPKWVCRSPLAHFEPAPSLF